MLLALLVVSLFVSLNVLASDEGSPEVIFDSSQGFEDPVTGEWIQPFDVLPDGSIELVSEEEYLADLEEMVVEEVDEEDLGKFQPVLDDVQPMYYEYWRFVRSGTRTQVNAPRIKASPDIRCTTLTCSASITVGASTSNSFSTSVTAERNAIKAGAGYSWTTSASSSTTFSYNLKRGDEGYIGFTPYHWRVAGTLELRGSQGTGLIRTKSAWGRYPKTLSNGQADGRYAFVYTRRG